MGGPQAALVTRWLGEWAETWNEPDVARVRVETSTRLRRSLGRCLPRKRTIRIHAALFDGHAELLREVVCHEAAHAACWMRHGPAVRPHGPEWKRLMRDAGYQPEVTLHPNRLPEVLRPKFAGRVLYHHCCPLCGAERIARRVVRRWRCRTCYESGLPGLLEIKARADVKHAP